jgi:putative phosphonate transport system ATP-binding protein
MHVTPLLRVRGVSKRFGQHVACDDVSLDLYPGQVLGLVGESGSGKSTLLRALVGDVAIDAGQITYVDARGERLHLAQLSEARRRRLMRTEWGLVHQNPRDGLRMHVSAGANVAERLLDGGVRHYGQIRREVEAWLREVEIDPARADERPGVFSGGMQQRLQLARVLVTHPRLVLMDEPTGGLDLSVQARLLDLIRLLVRDLHLSVIVVTHDIGVVRLIADAALVMRTGRIVESGIADRVLDDPQHPYTQLLVSAALVP